MLQGGAPPQNLGYESHHARRPARPHRPGYACPKPDFKNLLTSGSWRSNSAPLRPSIVPQPLRTFGANVLCKTTMRQGNTTPPRSPHAPPKHPVKDMLAHSAAAKPQQGRPGPSATPARAAAPHSRAPTASRATACCIVLQQAAKPAHLAQPSATNPATKCRARCGAHAAPDKDCQLHVLPLARRAAPLAHALRLARRHLRARKRPRAQSGSDSRRSKHLCCCCKRAAAAPGVTIQHP